MLFSKLIDYYEFRELKKVKKTLTSICIAAGLLFSTSVGVNAADVHYKDVKKTDNFYNSVQYLLGQKAISRTLPTFRPYDNVTRGQVASILAKVLDDRLREVEYSDVYSGVDFIDVPKTNQFYPYINKLEWNGIMRGYYLRDDSPIRAFGINQPLTRGQFAGIIVKAYQIPLIKLQSYKENGAVKSDIFDGQKFTYPWGQEIATLETLGILSGYNDGNYKPNTPINRSQFANMLYKVESGNLQFFNQSAIVNEFVKLGIQSDIATEKIKSLKNNDVLNYIASYGDTRYLDTITLAADMRKEGEILFRDINVKIVASKDTTGQWVIDVEKIVENDTTSSDTAKITP